MREYNFSPRIKRWYCYPYCTFSRQLYNNCHITYSYNYISHGHWLSTLAYCSSLSHSQSIEQRLRPRENTSFQTWLKLIFLVISGWKAVHDSTYVHLHQYNHLPKRWSITAQAPSSHLLQYSLEKQRCLIIVNRDLKIYNATKSTTGSKFQLENECWPFYTLIVVGILFKKQLHAVGSAKSNVIVAVVNLKLQLSRCNQPSRCFEDVIMLSLTLRW